MAIRPAHRTRLGKRDDYAGMMFRGWRAWIASILLLIGFFIMMDDYTYSAERWSIFGFWLFLCLIGWGILGIVHRACDVSEHMPKDQMKKEVRDRMIANPLTFVIGVIAFPLWPFAVAIIFLWWIGSSINHWSKGGRWAEDGTILTNHKTCPRCAVQHSGTCPRCGF